MQRKKIALAMAGAGARAVMYFGILDVFEEHGIKVDMFAACSSATFIALAYSCGTLDKLKERAMSMGSKDLWGLFEASFKGGVFSLNNVEKELREFVPYDNLEELPIPVAIVASDIIYGDEVVFTMGNVARAVKASCSMPGLFEPVVWGNKVLLDGGLFNIIPVEAANSWGADLIIGVDLASTRNLFTDRLLNLKRGYNFMRRPLKYVHRVKERAAKYLFNKEDEIVTIDKVKVPSMLSILDRAMDYAMLERKKGEYFTCDVIIKPDVHGFGDIAIKKADDMYMEGRRAAEMAMPSIKRLLR